MFKVALSLALIGLALAMPKIPNHGETDLMARYILHNTEWIPLGTISVSKGIEGYPFVGVKSIADGITGESTGIPYIYMTDLDVSGIDIAADNRVSFLASLVQGDYCKEQDWDPQDPRCARIFVSGKFVKVEGEEKDYGKQALIDHHPAMASWPENHGFYVGKVEIEQIMVIDWFGGVKYVNMDNYYTIPLTDFQYRYNKF